jgi:hypothetical protein
LNTLRIVSPRIAKRRHTTNEIRTDRMATRLRNSGDASAVSVAQTIVTFSGPIVARSRSTTSRGLNSIIACSFGAVIDPVIAA